MKTHTMTFALVAIFGNTAFAAFPAALPEFKNEKQLATWRAEQASKPAPQAATEAHAFYTGKPYVDSTGGYAFKYRSYNPELARWTSEDPRGFPDGANQNVYAPTPTNQIDPNGMMSVNGKHASFGESYIGSIPGWLYYATFSGSAWGTAFGNSGSLNVDSYIWGDTPFSEGTIHKDPTIGISIDPNGNLQYSPGSSSFGGADGVVGLGLSIVVEGTGTKALTFHVYAAWSLCAKSVNGAGIGADGGSISFGDSMKTDGPVCLGTFQFIE